MLADEPTVGQDRLTWAAVMGTLEAARREGAGVLVTTHDPGVVARADREVALRRPPQPAPDPEPERRPLLARVGPLALLAAALCVLPLPGAAAGPGDRASSCWGWSSLWVSSG